MTYTDLAATKQDAYIIKTLREAERRHLTRTQTLKYVGLPAELIDQATQRALASIPSLPAEAASEPEAAAETAPTSEPAIALDPEPEAKAAPAAAPPAEDAPAPAETRRQAASKGRARLAAARKAREEGAGEGPQAPSAPGPQRLHRAKGHKPKATRQQIHAPVAARTPTLNKLLDAGLSANEIAKEMNLGTARVYQIARQAGRPFGGSAKPAKAAQEPGAA